MWYDIYVSPLAIESEGLATEEESKSWKPLVSGNCTLAVAKDTARNAVRFGPNKTARVFRGKNVGKLVFQVVATPDPCELRLLKA